MSTSHWWCHFKFADQYLINSGIPHLSPLILEIFFLDISRLEPRLGVSPRLGSFYVSSQVLFFSLSLGFEFLCQKCQLLLRLLIVLIRL